MIRSISLTQYFLCLVLATGLAGCDKAPSNPPTKTTAVESSEPPPTVGDGHGHDHPSEGPHGGALIELGNEEFHAELVHDEKAGTVAIHILDGTAKMAVGTDAKDVTINLKHEGKGEQFKLAASPAQGDAQGKSSRFVSSDKELAKELDHEHEEAQLVVTINGKQFRGKIAHHHEGDGHDQGDHKHK